MTTTQEQEQEQEQELKTAAKPLNFLAMKGALEKLGKKGSEYIIKWDDISLDFRNNLRDDYGDLTELDSLESGMIQAIVGYIGTDNKFYPGDGFRRLAWIRQRLENNLSIPEIKVTLDYDSATTLGRLKLILNSATAKPLSLVEQGKGYQKLRDECNQSLAEISGLSHKSTAHIGQCLKLVDTVSEEVLDLIEEGFISPTEVIKLHQTMKPEEAKTTIIEAVELAKEQGKKATGKTIKAVREKKTKVEDQPSELSEDGDEFAEHKAIADFLGRLTGEQWEELDLGPLRVILTTVNKSLYQ